MGPLLLIWWGLAAAAEKPPRCEGLCDRIESRARGGRRAEYAPFLCRLARCETGDKCPGEIRSPSGRYHGPFQFSRGTWMSV